MCYSGRRFLHEDTSKVTYRLTLYTVGTWLSTNIIMTVYVRYPILEAYKEPRAIIMRIV